jgi:hypothetical protein
MMQILYVMAQGQSNNETRIYSTTRDAAGAARQLAL